MLQQHHTTKCPICNESAVGSIPRHAFVPSNVLLCRALHRGAFLSSHFFNKILHLLINFHKDNNINGKSISITITIFVKKLILSAQLKL
jgi:hypothetical protein